VESAIMLIPALIEAILALAAGSVAGVALQDEKHCFEKPDKSQMFPQQICTNIHQVLN